MNTIPEASLYATPPGSTSLRLLPGYKTDLDLYLGLQMVYMVCFLEAVKILCPLHCTL